MRATDKGKPSRHADIPVNVLIMGPNDFAPVFERKDGKFFLSENSPTGRLTSRTFIDGNTNNFFLQELSLRD